MCQEEWNWFKILSVKQCGMQCLTPFTETRLLRKQENLFFKRMCVLKISASYFLRRKKKKSVVNELLFGTGNSIWTSFLPEWGLQLGHRDDLTLEQLSCSQLLLSPGSRWGQLWFHRCSRRGPGQAAREQRGSGTSLLPSEAEPEGTQLPGRGRYPTQGAKLK